MKQVRTNIAISGVLSFLNLMGILIIKNVLKSYIDD